jgi:hypothetical protein
MQFMPGDSKSQVLSYISFNAFYIITSAGFSTLVGWWPFAVVKGFLALLYNIHDVCCRGN